MRLLLALLLALAPLSAAAQSLTVAAPGGYRLLSLGEKTPEAREIAGATFDGAGMNRLFAAAVSVSPGSSLTLRDFRAVNMPRLFIGFAGRELVLERGFIGSFGMAAKTGDHLEAVFVHSGHVVIRDTVFDGSAGIAAMVPNTITAVLFGKADAGPLFVELDGVTIRGVKAMGLRYPIQAGAKGWPAVWVVKNSRLQKGLSGVFGVTVEPGGYLRIIDGGGNVDPDTGQPVDHTWPKPAASD